MGTSISLPCDQVVNQVSEWLCIKESYIHNLKENLAALETAMEELKASRNDLLRRIEREENKGLQRLDRIQVWLTRVETIESQFDGLFSVRTTELQRLCLCGFFSKSLKSSYRYGKRVYTILKDVEILRCNGVFEVVAEQAQASEVIERPIQPSIIGQKTVLELAWNRLMEIGVGTMGLFGMGGVGKTTLLTQINNRFIEKRDAFDLVIWVVISKDLQIKRIQEEVAKKLGLSGNDDWNHKDGDQKACEIHNVLRRKKFVLLLDDIWTKVNLTKIGVPHPNSKNGNKVVFTTRSKDVCGRMGVDVEMEVQCLAPHNALDLFRKKLGEITLGSHPNIPELAMVVAKKCQGLPLALTVIGEAMSSKRTIQEWHHTIDVLTSNAAKFSEMEDEILPILKYSYDNLKGEHVKSCLLYCALFPEDSKFTNNQLIEYWICEGIIDESEGMERAKNHGYEIIGSLVRSSLLMECIVQDSVIMEDVVYMHDVVREMALWIASDFGKLNDHFVVHTGADLYKVLVVKNWNLVKRMSLMENKIGSISGSPKCLELTTLFLQRNTLENIFGGFFRSMPKLVVLDLSSNDKFSELPDGISQLVSLKYLNMSWTSIRFLPAGLQKLINLIHLDLEDTGSLYSIVGISTLLNLKVLKLRDSGVVYNLETAKELQDLEHLEIFTIGISSDSGLNQFLSSHKLLCCTQDLVIKDCQVESSDMAYLSSMEKVREITFSNCSISEIKIDIASIGRESVSVLNIPTKTFFLSLSTIDLDFCKGLKDLTWLMFAPKLAVLGVHGGDELEDIIHKEKAFEVEKSGIVPFQNLEYIGLNCLPELKNIYWRPLPFPCLKIFSVRDCPKLRKLPLNSKSRSSGSKRLVVHYKEREWLEGVEWKDEATKARFLPSCIKVEY